MNENNEMKTEEIIDVIFILDASRSMNQMKNEPIDAINDFIKDQKKLKDKSKFTLFTFNNKVNRVIDDKFLDEIEPFTEKEYNRCNMTALYDAIGQVITEKKGKDKNKDIVVVILTDGEENCSREYNKTSIKNLIVEMERGYGWKFIYLGANQDAYVVGNSIGIGNSSKYEYTPKGMSGVCKSASNCVRSYKSSKNADDLKKI